MKNVAFISLVALLMGCTREDDVEKKVDVNGTFTGKVTGKIDPYYIDGTATWVVVHQGSELTVDISYQNVTANGPGVPQIVTNYENQMKIKKYKATMTSDTTFVGGFTDITAKSVVNGKISKDGKKITCLTDGSDPTYNYVRFSFDLTKK